jgi:hypothetical protein
MDPNCVSYTVIDREPGKCMPSFENGVLDIMLGSADMLPTLQIWFWLWGRICLAMAIPLAVAATITKTLAVFMPGAAMRCRCEAVLSFASPVLLSLTTPLAKHSVNSCS